VITLGHAVVIYDSDLVVGGGGIAEIVKNRLFKSSQPYFPDFIRSLKAARFSRAFFVAGWVGPSAFSSIVTARTSICSAPL
jgi:hypothetical protein